MPRFVEMPMDPSQVMMFGRTVDESVPGDSDVRALSEVMDLLDWSEVECGYSDPDLFGLLPEPRRTALQIPWHRSHPRASHRFRSVKRD